MGLPVLASLSSCEAGDDLGMAADHIVAAYEVDRERALRDIVDLVADLRNHDLLVAP